MPIVEKNTDSELRLEIDRDRLADELVGQPLQLYMWATKVADAQLELDTAKSALSVTYAELDKEIRDDPESFGIAKLTNEVVGQTIITQPQHRAAEAKVNRCKHAVGVLKAAVDGLEHRKRALTLLVEIESREYYADPRSKRGEMTDEDKAALRNRGKNRLRDTEHLSEITSEDRDV